MNSFSIFIGALAYKYFVKDPKLVPIPLLICLVLQFTLGLGTSILIPVASIFGILFAYYLFKKEKDKIA